MGILSNILENPALIGLAMAGMSRDPEAPMNAMRSYSAMDEMKRKQQEMEILAQERAKKEKAEQAGLQLLNAIQQRRDATSGLVDEARQGIAGVRSMPSTIEQMMPNPQVSEAGDFDTAFSGQAADPRMAPQQVSNPNRSAAFQALMQKLEQRGRAPSLDLSQFQGASPSVVLEAMKYMDENKPMDKVYEMLANAQKPVSLKEGEQLLDPMNNYQPIAGSSKPKTMDRIKAGLFENPDMIDTLPPKLQQMLGVMPKDTVPNSEPEVIYALENETDPAKRAILGKVLKGIQSSQERRASLGRPPKDNTFEMKEKRAIDALAEEGVTKPTRTQVAGKMKEMYGVDNKMEEMMEAFRKALSPGSQGGSSPKKTPNAPKAPASPKGQYWDGKQIRSY